MRSLNKNEKVAIGASILVIGFFFAFGNSLITLFKTGQLPTDLTGNSTATSTDTTTPQLTAQDITVGTGDVAEAGETVTVNYVGQFTNGTVFDSSTQPGRSPFTFILGAGQVIKGWDQGIVGMKVGGKRTLIVPPELGYGSTDYGPIPANSTLVFQVELLSVQK